MRSVKIRQPKVNQSWALFAQYPYIYAWGMHMESFEYYIVDQINKAIRDKAPRTATFENYARDGWHTIEDCKNEGLKFLLQRHVNAQFPDNNISLP